MLGKSLSTASALPLLPSAPTTMTSLPPLQYSHVYSFQGFSFILPAAYLPYITSWLVLLVSILCSNYTFSMRHSLTNAFKIKCTSGLSSLTAPICVLNGMCLFLYVHFCVCLYQKNIRSLKASVFIYFVNKCITRA